MKCKRCGGSELAPDPSGHYEDATDDSGRAMCCVGECKRPWWDNALNEIVARVFTGIDGQPIQSLVITEANGRTGGYSRDIFRLMLKGEMFSAKLREQIRKEQWPE